MSTPAPTAARRLGPVVLATVPAWFAPAVAAVALAAAASLEGRPAGLGLTLTLWAVLAAVAAVTRRSAWSSVAWIVAAALCAMATLRAATWVVVLSVLLALVLAAGAAAGARTWRSLGQAWGLWILNLIPGPVLVFLLVARRAGSGVLARVAPGLRGAVVALPLLLVFGALFAAADAAFAEILDDLGGRFVDIDAPWERAGIALLVVAGAGSLLTGAHARHVDSVAPAARTLARGDWVVVLGSLAALFAAFVAVQLTTLFGGHDHVLRTAGLTYSQYAREGFGQLVAVAALTLVVIAGARRWARRDSSRDERLLRALLGLLCALTLVVLASALKRLGLYMDAYGATRLRLFAEFEILALAGVFGLVIAAGLARSAAWLPRAVVTGVGVAWLAFALSNPDGRIASRNLAGGPIDLYYLSELSADAAPALARSRICVSVSDDDGVAGFNLARRRARGSAGRCGR